MDYRDKSYRLGNLLKLKQVAALGHSFLRALPLIKHQIDLGTAFLDAFGVFGLNLFCLRSALLAREARLY